MRLPLKSESGADIDAFSYHDDAEHLLKEVKAEFQKTWKYQCDNWAALDGNAYGVPISGIIRAYNSMFIQPDPYFCAELNYYKSFRSAYDLAFETGDYSKETAKIGGAFDVTAALKEASKHSLKTVFNPTWTERALCMAQTLA